MAQIKTWFCQKIMAFSDRADDRRDGILARRTNDIDDIDGESDHQYFPSPRRLIHTTISNTPIHPENLTFVDFGSGMGRVVFCAAIRSSENNFVDMPQSVFPSGHGAVVGTITDYLDDVFRRSNIFVVIVRQVGTGDALPLCSMTADTV